MDISSLFDNNDRRIPHYELLLRRSLASLPESVLPEGYRFVFYRPGDRETWIGIEQSAKEFNSPAEGYAAWERYYAGRESELEGRMLFVENGAGEKVATATAMRHGCTGSPCAGTTRGKAFRNP